MYIDNEFDEREFKAKMEEMHGKSHTSMIMLWLSVIRDAVKDGDVQFFCTPMFAKVIKSLGCFGDDRDAVKPLTWIRLANTIRSNQQ